MLSSFIGEQADTPDNSFEEFFHEHSRRLFGTMSLITGDRGMGEELTQEAFLRIWQRWERVRELDDPGGYLFQAAFNLWKSRRRRTMSAARGYLSAGTRRDAFDSVDERLDLLSALRQLTPRQRAAIVLTHLLGHSAHDAASFMGVRPATVRSLAFQGRQALRATLEQPGG